MVKPNDISDLIEKQDVKSAKYWTRHYGWYLITFSLVLLISFMGRPDCMENGFDTCTVDFKQFVLTDKKLNTICSDSGRVCTFEATLSFSNELDVCNGTIPMTTMTDYNEYIVDRPYTIYYINNECVLKRPYYAFPIIQSILIISPVIVAATASFNYFLRYRKAAKKRNKLIKKERKNLVSRV